MIKKQCIILIRNANSFDFGGGERFPVFVASILKKNNIEPLIISKSPRLLSFASEHAIETIKGLWWPKQNWNSYNVLFIPAYLFWQFILFFWYLYIFAKVKPQAVHIQSKDDFIAATFAAKAYGKKVIWTDHADLKHIWKNVKIWYKNPVGKLVYLAAYLTDHITVVSHSEYKLVCRNIKNNDFIIQKIQIIYNGTIDNKNIKKIPQKKFTFCVASRLVSDKGINEVICAFKKLLKEYRNIKLLLLGDGPESDYFKEKNIKNHEIIFMGYQSNPLPIIAGSDVFIHPTYHEGFSLALVEASMLQKPIIATSVGGNVEIIKNQETGLLVKSKNAESLYNAMKLLYQDEKLCKKLGENARIQYEIMFNFDNIVVNSFIPLYN